MKYCCAIINESVSIRCSRGEVFGLLEDELNAAGEIPCHVRLRPIKSDS